MAKDLSNETVFILAVLAILISILGAATVFFETSKIEAFDDGGPETSASSGTIMLNIVDSPKESSSHGQISLNIVNGETD